jgi:homoserine dehydrogenase
VYVRSYALGGSMYYGAGAGMLPTAMSVVSDIIDLGRSIYARAAGAARARRPPVAARPLMPIDELRGKFYVRFAVVDRPGVLGQLMTTLGAHGVSIAQVVQEDAPAKGRVPVVALTHEAREGDLRAALAEIDRTDIAAERTRVIRIAG